ncbi:RNA methyltransferase [uncultured Eudoraea sp.]|uniref:TrmH family RNA methyltransferase n=1 Tax=uncultured Eudoraea sp. TaxID=1035614 RepID=UPI00262C50B1|nr:RNA methyltransferase [uncultured Eudoraea sp.]
MVVKSQLKFIKSLYQKKYRIENGLFIAEGKKMVSELLRSKIKSHSIYTTDSEFTTKKETAIYYITEKDLLRISAQKSPNKMLGIFEIPSPEAIDYSDWVVVLDAIQDPGNLGTIIRLCDWFGIEHLICSRDTADCYNSKALQSTMGSIARVNIVYADIAEVLKKNTTPVFGTYMNGSSVYTESLPEKGILILGNEGRGISEKVGNLIAYENRLGIPQYGKRATESLNVATATAIFLSEIRRQQRTN